MAVTMACPTMPRQTAPCFEASTTALIENGASQPLPRFDAPPYHVPRQPMASGNARQDPVVGVSENGEALVVRLAGELDLYNTPVLREALLEYAARNPTRLVVDLAEVTFIDSTALGALIEARASLGSKDGFVLASPGLEARRALEISGLDRHFEVSETLEDALKP
ncbi:MAG: STAS domain-containing protein [Actinobacteria bacterium]|nr:MAG: STAS domain-containing protein [Actinomycetota bacterium]